MTTCCAHTADLIQLYMDMRELLRKHKTVKLQYSCGINCGIPISTLSSLSIALATSAFTAEGLLAIYQHPCQRCEHFIHNNLGEFLKLGTEALLLYY